MVLVDVYTSTDDWEDQVILITPISQTNQGSEAQAQSCYKEN